MSVNHSIRVRNQVFLPSDCVAGNSVLYHAMNEAKQLYIDLSADHYDTVCMCSPGGVPIGIRRTGTGSKLYFARWPDTAMAHSASCSFRHSSRMPGIGHDAGTGADGTNEMHLNWDFDGPGTFIRGRSVPGRANRGSQLSVPRSPSDSLHDVLARVWHVSGLDALNENSPIDWFDTVNRVIDGVRQLSFGKNLALENYFRIWAERDKEKGQKPHRKAISHNASVDTSGDFLALGEVYALSGPRLKGYLPFRHFHPEVTVFMQREKIISAIGGNSRIEYAIRNPLSEVIGLAHVRNTGERYVAVSLSLMEVDKRYLPIRPV